MIARRTAWLTLALLSIVAAASSCAREAAPPNRKEFEFGARRVQVTVPTGWDALDQGNQKRFRRGEAEIVLQILGKVDLDAAVASLQDDRRRELKSRSPITIDGHEAVDIEMWNRLEHTWPQRLLFVRMDDDLLSLEISRLADADTAKAFDAIRDSLHFVSARR